MPNLARRSLTALVATVATAAHAQPSATDWSALAERNGDAGGIFLEAALADGTVMTYSTELPTE